MPLCRFCHRDVTPTNRRETRIVDALRADGFCDVCVRCAPLVQPRIYSASAVSHAIRRVGWWKRALDYWDNRCAYCGAPNGLLPEMRIGIDHWIPLSYVRGPGNAPDNILPACATCNSSKRTRSPQGWVMERFGPHKGKEIVTRIEAYFDYMRSCDF